MARRRPSGPGSNSTRLATVVKPDGSEVKIPTARAAATAWYVATAEGDWPPRDTLMVDTETNWLREEDVIELIEMRAGHGMGNCTTYRVAEIRNQLRHFEGRYGQVLRLVLLVPVASPDSLEDLGFTDLERI